MEDFHRLFPPEPTTPKNNGPPPTTPTKGKNPPQSPIRSASPVPSRLSVPPPPGPRKAFPAPAPHLAPPPSPPESVRPVPKDSEFSALFEPSVPATNIKPPTPPLKENLRGSGSGSVHSDDGLIVSPDHKPHVILLKKFSLLLVIVLIMILSVIGIFLWSAHQNRFGYPPTEFSEEAYSNTLFALLNLFLTCLSSLIILRGKVHHLVIGYMIMFQFVLTFYFCLKGGSRAIASIQYDDIITIEKYVFSKYNNRSQGELPHFFHRLQINFQCCGTHTVDKMKDWPERLLTDDMPRSCCIKPTSNCGRKLARTRTYTGGPNEPMRIPSGHFLVLTESEMNGIVESGKPVRIHRPPGKDKGLNTVRKTIREFYFESLKNVYLPNTPLDQMKRWPNDIIEPEDVERDNLPLSIGCRENSSTEKVTTIGWQIQYMLDYETSVIYEESSSSKYQWIAWQIPMCQEISGQPPFHLASNYKREVTDIHTDIKHMWYLSRGITENYILKDYIWELYCENAKTLRLLPDTSKLTTFLGSRQNMEGKAIGKFYISFVHKLMISCLISSIIVAILLFFVFLIFWTYYSRMKLEEYANLPYAPEFDVLKVRQSDLYEAHDKAEYDKNKFKELLHDDEDDEDNEERERIKSEFDKKFVPSASPSRRTSVPPSRETSVPPSRQASLESLYDTEFPSVNPSPTTSSFMVANDRVL